MTRINVIGGLVGVLGAVGATGSTGVQGPGRAALGTSSPLQWAQRPIKRKGKRTKRQRAAKRRQKMARASKQRNRR